MKLNIQMFADGRVIIEADLDTKSFDRQIASLEYELQEYQKQYEAYINAGRKLTQQEQEDFQKLSVKIEQTKNQIISLKEKQDALTVSTEQHGFKLDGTIKKIGKWTLALFGVRSAYMFVRQAASTLSNTNEKIGADIQYMRWALAQMLEKVVIRVIQWAYKLLQIINYLVYGITGINLFANASAKAFERQNKAMGGTAKSAKQLQKTLAGFDEMNILQENGGTSYGGGGGGISLPTEDLSTFSEISGTLKEKLDKIIKVLKPVWEWITKIVTKLGGVQTVLLGLIGMKLLSKIGALLGTGGTATAVGATGLLGILKVLGLLVADYWLIKVAYKGVKEADKEAKSLKTRMENLNKTVTSGTKSWEANSKELVENAKSGKYSEEQNQRLADSIFKNIENNKAINKSLQDQYVTGNFVVDMWTSMNGTSQELLKTSEKLQKEQENDIKLLTEMYKSGLLTDKQKQQLIQTYEKYIETLEKEQKRYVKNSDAYNDYTKKIDSLKNSLNNIKGNYDAKINVSADTTKARNKITDLLKDVQSAGIAGALGLTNIASSISKIKYAKGGIINMPGRGVPIAYGGEQGKEGVVPLTDSQQMALLGEAIGKYISLNATIPVYVGNRQVARELRKIELEDSFAGNR